jgi:transcriptional regulator with XRE-family HTH domain
MIIDCVKMRAARDRRALTQEALAAQARVNVRTIQRAERGEPIRHETLADIAAVLGVPPAGLVRVEAEMHDDDPEADAAQTQLLKRVESAETVIAALERAAMSVLDCSAPPTEKNMPILRKVITQLEGLMPKPWEGEEGPPLRFSSLLARLEALAALEAELTELERSGLALYSGASTEFVKVPVRGEHGPYVAHYQWPEYVMAARFLIAEYSAERVRVSADVLWPLKIEEAAAAEPADDLDEDIPF